MNARFVQFFLTFILTTVCLSVTAGSYDTKITAETSNNKVKEIAFVDAGIKNSDSLLREIDPNVDIVFIDSQRDGVEQIAETLATQKDISAIHILSHGHPGILDLGATKLSATSIQGNHADEMAVIRGALSQNADILIYGCNFAQDTHGARAVELLAAATGADVVASDNLTGASALGGDWVMEVQSGVIETAQINAEAWNGVLAPIDISVSTAPVLSGGTAVGATALWTNAGFVGTTAIDLRAKVISGAGTTIVFFNFNDEVVVRTQSTVETTILWEVFETGTGQTVTVSGEPTFLIVDVDGAGGVPESVETIAADTTGLFSYTVANPTNLVVTAVNSTIRASGTQPQGALTEENGWISYSWTGVSSWEVTYQSYETANHDYIHDGDGDNTFTDPVVTLADSTPPVVAITSSLIANAANSATYSVSGNCTAGDGDVTVSITGAAPASQPVTCTGGGIWGATFDVLAIADGTNAIIMDASQTDAATNTGNATQVLLDKDTAAPAVATTSNPVANTANVATYPVSGTCTTGDGNVTVSIVGVAPSQSVACNTGAWGPANFDVSGITDGTNVIDVNASQTDSAGNTGNAALVEADKDTGAPVVVTTSAPTSNAANVATYPVSGTCTTGDGNVTVSIVGVAPSQSVACSTGAWGPATFNVSGITDGTNVIDVNASQTDSAGNTGNAALVEANKDTGAPVVVTTSAPTANAANAATYPVSGTCTAGDGNVAVSIVGVAPSQSVACSAGAWGPANFDVSAITDGTNVIDINASQTDSVGNTGNAALVEADKDAAAPAVATTSAPVANTANAATYPVSGTCTTGDGNVTVSIVGVTPSQSVACGAGTWGPANFDVSAITDGTNVIDVNASQTDSVGNTGNAALVEADKDAAAPAVATTSAPVANTANAATYPVSGTCTAGDGNVTVSIVGVAPSQSVACGAGAWGPANFNVSGITNGTNVIDVNASQTDSAGNTGNAALVEADKDTGAPAVATTSAPVANTANAATYPVSGTCTAGDGNVTVSIVGVAPSQSVACGAGAWGPANFNVSGITDGTNVIDVNASQTDSVGNTGNAALVEADKDTVAPVVATTSAPVANAANVSTYPVSGTCTTGDGNVTVSIVGVAPSQSVACSAGAWGPATFNVSGITDGTNVIDVNASQTDSVGNTGNAALVEADKDAAAPAVVTTSAPVANAANAATYPVSGTCTAGDGNVTVSIVGVAPSQSVACSAGAWGPATFNVSGITDGTNVIDVNASQTDSVGNTGNAALVEADKDTGAPVVVTTSAPVANAANAATYPVSGTCTAGDGNVTVSIVGVAPSQSVACSTGTWGPANFNVSGITDGTNVIDVNASQTDSVGNTGNAALVEADKDAVAPTVDIQGEPGSTNITPFNVTFEFSEDVTGFVVGDITVGNGTAGTFATTDGNTYTADITPDGNGAITIDVAAGVAQDVATNANTAATQAVVSFDNDADNDGIPDNIECPGAALPFTSPPCPDADGDTIPDALETDSDNDGILDANEVGTDNINPIDSDGDTIPDYRDTDSDGDGIDDAVEGAGDSDGDGIPDYVDVGSTGDSDGDGIPDSVECAAYPACPDSNDDGQPDYTEIDSDGDGINDDVEAGVDPTQPRNTDANFEVVLEPDYQDLDSDEDGASDSAEGTGDADSDGIPDYVDAASAGPGAGDSDLDGIFDNIECGTLMYTLCVDSDADSTPDYMETDSDGDGILDVTEAGTSGVDTDVDGIPDLFDADADGNEITDVGVLDLNDDGIIDGLINTHPLDSDGDGTPDYQDIDSDNDGTDDAAEAGNDIDSDGIPDYVDVDTTGPGVSDSDGDGVTDDVECPAYPVCLDTDGDGKPDYLDGKDQDGPLGNLDGDLILENYLDPNDDNDGIPDAVEDLNIDGDDNPFTNPNDTDGDGIPNYQDTDSDEDGALDSAEGITDTDSDGIPDYVDADDAGPGAGDSDGDGASDAIECANYPACPDTDTDGVPDYMDADSTPGVSGATTTISVSAASVVADGTTVTITVQAKDANGNNFTVSGGAVTLASTGSGTVSAVTDNGDGTYTATISNQAAEAVTISGTIAGTAITSTATVTFTAVPTLAPISGGGSSGGLSNNPVYMLMLMLILVTLRYWQRPEI